MIPVTTKYPRKFGRKKKDDYFSNYVILLRKLYRKMNKMLHPTLFNKSWHVQMHNTALAYRVFFLIKKRMNNSNEHLKSSPLYEDFRCCIVYSERDKWIEFASQVFHHFIENLDVIAFIYKWMNKSN